MCVCVCVCVRAFVLACVLVRVCFYMTRLIGLNMVLDHFFTNIEFQFLTVLGLFNNFGANFKWYQNIKFLLVERDDIYLCGGALIHQTSLWTKFKHMYNHNCDILSPVGVKIGNISFYIFICICVLRIDLSRLMTKPTKWECAQRRLRSAWASAQSDQSLRCPHEETLGP